MSTTFAAFVSAIQNEINDSDAAMKTRIEGWVNDLMHRICSSHRWQWLITTSASTLIKSSNHPYTLSSLSTKCRTVLDVRDEDDSPPKPLYPTTEDAVRNSLFQYTSATNSPSWWYVQADVSLGLFPIPDTTGRNYTIRYIQQYVSLGTGSTTALLLPDRWLEVLKDAVLSKAYSWLDKDNKALKHEAAFQGGLKAMKAQDGENQQAIYQNQFGPPDIFPNEIVFP